MTINTGLQSKYHVPLRASCWSQPSPAGRARRQVSFLWEAIIEKKRSSANLVHQALRSSLDSTETLSVVTRSGFQPVIVNAGAQRRAQPLTEYATTCIPLLPKSRSVAEVEQLSFSWERLSLPLSSSSSKCECPVDGKGIFSTASTRFVRQNPRSSCGAPRNF